MPPISISISCTRSCLCSQHQGAVLTPKSSQTHSHPSGQLHSRSLNTMSVPTPTIARICRLISWFSNSVSIACRCECATVERKFKIRRWPMTLRSGIVNLSCKRERSVQSWQAYGMRVPGNVRYGDDVLGALGWS
ncbi:hypothetical protein SERLADRAFT_476589 [Serpula lacrymans var. lacrymans S7.9]|uniref:Uncharacterized protein n=1 Tax=Serpula lacrymans var. lacrymans (strain S7.9) TaxID=578457 RepID=F8P7K6_SERL9|nr:uncharacterized protein SERLADRAFT_476589 [Serpula lacrymans var. lacrymans S7.9]EGO21417.1 hypothetical protein SERLADRAFT_476589 [Serpula lacrymans var. lacrymans S7.9]